MSLEIPARRAEYSLTESALSPFQAEPKELRFTPQPFNEILIHASCEKVFANMADAQAWPSWYPNSQNIKLLNSPDGKLHEGTRFSWDTFGLHFESRVHEFAPNSRIGWFGDSPSTNNYHTYFLSKTHEGCLVVTEEVVKGAGAVELRKNQPQAMHEGHDLWLNALKQRSEN
jgi:uncharacterized protein YndB with AHSA1/START domain